MRAPAFWQRKPGLAALALAPLGWCYGALTAARMAGAGVRAGIPVICVGNPTAGGTGKTPVAIALARRLAARGERPVLLTRGHGGRERGPRLVDPARDDAATVGDEPLLLARAAPTIVARDRPAGAMLALRQGAGVIVMDDGLQNPSLARDLSLMLVDAAAGIGNGLCLPAGPLRAPLGAHWPRVDALVLVGEGEAGAALAAEAARHGRPVLRVALVPDETAAAALCGRRVLAFAGIGRPAKFFETLRVCGAEVAEARAFADHHPFTRAEIEALARDAAAGGLVPVTTEKDAVRLGPLASLFGDDGPAVLPVTARFADEPALDALLDAALARSRAADRAR